MPCQPKFDSCLNRPMEDLIYQLLIVTSSLSFLIYAIGALTMKSMKLEFERYGLAKFRVLIGCLQLAAVIGLLIGNRFPIVGFLASGGLTLQMLVAVLKPPPLRLRR